MQFVETLIDALKEVENLIGDAEEFLEHGKCDSAKVFLDKAMNLLAELVD